MSPVRSTFTKVLAVAGLGVASFPILLVFAPNIEQSRTEARMSEAYRQVVRFRNADLSNSAADSLPSADPWGQPYRTTVENGQIVRVVSSGPNMSTPLGGFDHDDIYSDMPLPPIQAVHTKKNRQWLFALGSTISTWGILTVLYLWLSRSSAS